MTVTVSTQGIAKATRVDRAVERLEAAVARVDDAISTASLSAPQTDDALQEALRLENATLRSLTEEAAAELTTAISKLQSMQNGDG